MFLVWFTAEFSPGMEQAGTQAQHWGLLLRASAGHSETPMGTHGSSAWLWVPIHHSPIPLVLALLPSEHLMTLF